MPIKILSLDGGGSKGIFHLYFLRELENALQRCTRDSFDYIGGTSVGGIIALTVTHPIAWMGWQNNYTVADMLRKKVDEKLLSVIFGPPRHFLKLPRIGIFGPKYCDRINHMQDFYDNEFFGKSLLFGGDNIKPTMVFSYSLVDHEVRVFKSWRPVNQDTPLSTIARATSAAPVFFPAVSHNGDILIDGGVAANDPSYLIGYEARKNSGNLAAPLIIVSLGTSYGSRTDYGSCHSAGGIFWATKFVNLMMESQQRIMSYLQGHDGRTCLPCCEGGLETNCHEILQVNETVNVFADYHYWNNVHYFRFTPITGAGLDSIDPKILKELEDQALGFFNGSSKIVQKMTKLMQQN